MLYRVTGAQVNQVRIPLPVTLKEIAVIPRRGDTRVRHGQCRLNTTARTRLRSLHRDPPGVSPRA